MAEKRAYKQYSNEFKEDVISLVRDQGYSVAKAAESVGIKPSLLYKWKEKIELELTAKSLDPNERDELKRLRKEVKELRMEKEVEQKCLTRCQRLLYSLRAFRGTALTVFVIMNDPDRKILVSYCLLFLLLPVVVVLAALHIFSVSKIFIVPVLLVLLLAGERGLRKWSKIFGEND